MVVGIEISRGGAIVLWLWLGVYDGCTVCPVYVECRVTIAIADA